MKSETGRALLRVRADAKVHEYPRPRNRDAGPSADPENGSP